ncbi:MAG: hypothetical protein R3D52_15295 [Xanthobacteraceae bacterium]
MSEADPAIKDARIDNWHLGPIFVPTRISVTALYQRKDYLPASF